MLDRRQMILALAALPLLTSNPSRALAAKPALRVTGGASGAPVDFDAAGLDALPQTRFVTATPWNAKPIEFRGVSARDLFQAAGVTGEHLQLIALNDYVVEAKTSDILAGDGLFATHQDGVPMPISAKGPVFLMFPFDLRPELKHQSYYSRSVWQLAEVVVTP